MAEQGRATKAGAAASAGAPAGEPAGAVRWVDTDRALDDLVRVLLDEPAYGLDTEFLSDRTYWPQLCLVQISWTRGVALVDPLACDMRALAEVLRAPATMVTHAGGADLPILERAVGALPTGLFDLQVAAGFVGLGSPSLASLASILLDVVLDKSEQLTDWSTRPLTPAAFRYAADDVAHLLPLAGELGHRLQAVGRESWAATECEQLRVAPTKRGDPDTAWWKIKGASSMRGEKARIAQAVAAWLETRAQRRDVPPRAVLSDLALAALTNRPPRDVDEVRALRGISGMPRDVARELLAAVEAGRAMDAGALRLPLRYDERPELDAAVSLLTAWVGELASRERLDKKLLATRDDITALVYGRPSKLDTGWRARLAGDGLRSLLAGDGVLRLVDGGRHLSLES